MDTAGTLLGKLPIGRNDTGFKGLRSEVKSYLPDDQVARVVEAYEFGAAAHKGQTRLTGEPYISHPVAAALILAQMRMDCQTIIAALLHDVIEDTEFAKGSIAERFGDEVAGLVDGVSKLDQIQFKSKAEAQAESFRKMIMAMAEDIRVILVKLADRLHNMRTLGVMPPVKRRRIARETLDIYAPIANRLGINSIKLELEDLGFRALYPQRSKVIEKSLKRARGNQRQLVRKISANIATTLRQNDIAGEVQGREKHLYSIYQKMRKKGRSLSEIVDVFGFRIVVDSDDLCYRTLGIVHMLYKPMPGRFKDYIAIPRVNGYQSLHTTLFGPNSMPIEVQIRTRDQDRLAESGIAAHWLYKVGDNAGTAAPQARARQWLIGLMEMQDGGNSEEFLESVKIDLFPDKVYLFTPRGDILRLPRGATSVDFAYAVHTDVGNRCVAAKIDRRLMPLRTPLHSGQTIEIITAKGAKPNPAWLNFVVTAKARASIRAFLKNLRSNEAAVLGKKLLERALGEFKLTQRKVPKTRFQAVLDELGVESRNALFEQIGLGERLAPLIARRLTADAAADAADSASAQSGPLAIDGTEGMIVTYARCCFPLPGDSIMGHLSAGRGIVVHRDRCGNLGEFRKQPEKWLSVEWRNEIEREFTAEIRVEVFNRLGVLATVAAKIAETKTNIEHVSVVERDGDTSSLTFQLQLTALEHYARVVKSISSMPDVLSVSRTCA